MTKPSPDNPVSQAADLSAQLLPAQSHESAKDIDSGSSSGVPTSANGGNQPSKVGSVIAGVLAASVVICPPLGSLVLISVVSTSDIPQTLREMGWAGVAIYAMSFWLLGIFAMPTYAWSVLGGWCFGFVPGFVGAVASYLGAMTTGYLLASKFLRGPAQTLASRYPAIEAVRKVIADASFARTVGLVALLRISPASPFAVTNFALAGLGVKFVPYAIGSILGVAPRSIVVVYLASKMAQLDFKSPRSIWVLAIGVGATIAVLAIIQQLAKRELVRLSNQATSS